MDKYGNTPLHIAAKYGHELLISTLMTNGADTARYATGWGEMWGGFRGFQVRRVCCEQKQLISGVSPMLLNAFECFSLSPDVGSMECSPCT